MAVGGVERQELSTDCTYLQIIVQSSLESKTTFRHVMSHKSVHQAESIRNLKPPLTGIAETTPSAWRMQGEVSYRAAIDLCDLEGQAQELFSTLPWLWGWGLWGLDLGVQGYCLGKLHAFGDVNRKLEREFVSSRSPL